MKDVVIIGGGVIGCAVARELSRYKLEVALLEKSEDICDGQSKANTAIVHGGYDAVPNTLKAKFNVLGNKMFDRIAKELNVPFERNTSMVLSFSDNDEDKSHLRDLKQQGELNGVEGLEIIDAKEVRRREPNVSGEVHEALLVPNGGIVCPYELTQAYAENAAENGVEFFRNAQVTDITLENGVYDIESTAGSFRARAVVNAAGVYADKINNMVSNNKIEIIPRKGEYYIVDKSFENTFKATLFQLPTNMGKGTLVAPTVDGTILIGPTAEDIEDKDDTSNTSFGLEKALNLARKTWEDIPTRSFITTFSGIRSHPTTGDFIVGETQDSPLFFNAAGIESPGLTSSPAIGDFLAKEIAAKLNAQENKSFNPVRKPLTKFRDLSNLERAKVISTNSDYAKIVCRCETITEAEIRESIRRPVGARSLDGVKRRTRAGMGRCQAGFCSPRVLEILCEELNLPPTQVTKCGGESVLITGYLNDKEGK